MRGNQTFQRPTAPRWLLLSSLEAVNPGEAAFRYTWLEHGTLEHPHSASLPLCLLTPRSTGDGPPGHFPRLPRNSLSLSCRDGRVPTKTEGQKGSPQMGSAIHQLCELGGAAEHTSTLVSSTVPGGGVIAAPLPPRCSRKGMLGCRMTYEALPPCQAHRQPL